MAKVSKKTLGKRRRGALYVLLILLIGIVTLIVRCSRDPAAEDAGVSISPADLAGETTAPAQTTTQITYQAVASQPVVTTEVNVRAVGEIPESAYVDVEPILQLPELPTGCEITSLTMVLNFLGYDVDKCTMADEYLIRADAYTATFGEAFIGSPYDANAWGCYAPVIVETAENFLRDMGSSLHVYNLTGSILEEVLWEVAEGRPVIIWASIDMTDDIEERYYWTTDDGKDAVFLINEHCLVLCGYDLAQSTVTVCDPLVGLTEYDLTIFEDRFNRMYNQAVVLDD